MDHTLLYLLGRQIAPHLEGRRLDSIRLLRPLLVVGLTGPNHTHLVVTLSSPGPFCHLAAADPLDGAGEVAFRRIEGRRVQRVDPDLADRILRLQLDGETLAIYPFGSAARVRVESAGTIVESLDVRETGRVLRPAGQAPAPLDPGAIERLAAAPICLDTAPVAHATVVPCENGAPDRRGPFADVATACETLGSEAVADARRQILARRAGPARRSLDKRLGLRDHLAEELEAAEAFETGRQEANILAAYQSRIAPGSTSVELPDLYHADRTVRIELDPALTVREQIERRFKRASKLERSRAALIRRIAEVERDIDGLERGLRDADGASFVEGLTTLDRLLATYAPRAAAGRTGRAGAQAPSLRRFALGPNWFAIVGRNDRENDEITFRIARPDDIWMHAQQVPGSHVVLRSRGAAGNPPPPVLDAAAGIAAYYSKAKHSNLVPVIYTQRKYVRKFRGAKPGQVICEREKTVFTRPRLPDDERGKNK